MMGTAEKAARDKLVREVLGLDARGPDGPWCTFCYVAPNGSCVANVEAAVLPLVADGARRAVGAIRAIAVDPAWRGLGLFRDLMEHALAWCDGRSVAATLLYTEEPMLYRRFGFAPVPQHAVVGAAPAATPGPKARRLAPEKPTDAALIQAAIERRAPVSMRCALVADAGTVFANLVEDSDLEIVHAADLDAVIAYEIDADRLTLVDILAPAIPGAAAVVGALEAHPPRLATLFSPDRLGWDGAPVAEDTGLMLRGTLPAAMARPFMFPPTCEF